MSIARLFKLNSIPAYECTVYGIPLHTCAGIIQSPGRIDGIRLTPVRKPWRSELYRGMSLTMLSV